VQITLRSVVAVILLVLAGLATQVSTASADRRPNRKGRWEFYLLTNWVDSQTIEFTGRSSIDVSDDHGWGFGFGYNVNEHFELAGEFSWISANYRVNTLDQNNQPARTSGRLDAGTTNFNGTYNILKGPITPYVTGGLGWTFIDSNIPSGPPGATCWWDPWWGYVCSGYQPTHTESSFSYNVGAGLRWDVTESFFLKGGVSNLWIDMKNASPSFLKWQLTFGLMF
jgi:opacity protein-like surface antigen